MTKTTAALGTLGLGATATIATPLAVKFGNGSSSFDNRRYRWGGSKILLTSSTDIKTKYTSFECLKKNSWTRNWWGEQIQNGNPDIPLIKEDLKGCLIIEYYKQENQTKTKWKGGFKLVWSVSNDQENLITVINADTGNGKLILDSSIYVVSAAENIKHKKENIEKQLTGSDELSNYLPKWGSSLKNGGNDDYWGFNPELDKICKDNECSDISREVVTPTLITWNLTTKDNSSGSIVDWCTNFDTWFNNLFSEWSNVVAELKKLKGTWTGQSQ